eukprot:1364863-Rhodomonas_salina.2
MHFKRPYTLPENNPHTLPPNSTPVSLLVSTSYAKQYQHHGVLHLMLDVKSTLFWQHQPEAGQRHAVGRVPAIRSLSTGHCVARA